MAAAVASAAMAASICASSRNILYASRSAFGSKPNSSVSDKYVKHIMGFPMGRYHQKKMSFRISGKISAAAVTVASPVEEDVKEEISVKHSQKLEEVRHLLNEVDDHELDSLILIDTLQHLGIDYLFREEIETILGREYIRFQTHGYPQYDLYDVSTRFRLLRQEGYYVPADVFNKFKDENGNFKSTLRGDIKGLMGLYEASQLSIEGEIVLDGAADFSSSLLKSGMEYLDIHQARLVEETLDHPYRKSLVRFTTKSFLDDFKCPYRWINVLKELANLEFKKFQSTRQKEIIKLSSWWKHIGLDKDLKFVRGQPLKWYTWTTAVLTDPNLSSQRIDLTKALSLIYIIDDVFDVRGELDQLELFTEVVDNWDYAAVEQLPDYMKACFKALYDTTNEISNNVYKAHQLNPKASLKNSWATLCHAFLVEAKWFALGKLPKAEEYLKTATISSGVPTGLVHVFHLLGHDLSYGDVDLTNEIPEIMSSSATVLRLWDDLGSAKDENQDGNDGSYINCFIEENQGTSVESAKNHVVNMISNMWKRLNQECLSPSPFSSNFRNASLGVAKMVPLMYNYDENHRLPILEEIMRPMLHDGGSFIEI